jgi:hypothetical protein
MKRQEIKDILNELTADIDSIADKKAVGIIKVLVNLVEILAEENALLREKNQQLMDEINRLKGEQGKPKLRKQKEYDDDESGNNNHSSEEDRKKRSDKRDKKAKNKKSQTVKIDRQVMVEIDKTNLPDDAEFKGYEKRIVQDLKIITDNVEIILPTYYSRSLKKTFIAPLPIEYQGSEFGPGMKSLVITLYRDSGMTIPAIERFLKTFTIQISRSTISDMLIEKHDHFHQEKEDIIDAGLKATAYQHLDDTGARVNGKNHYTHTLCNPYFTAYFTRPKKDRMTILELLCRGELKFLFNQDAFDLMVELGLPSKQLQRIHSMLQQDAMTRNDMDALLQQLFPNPKKHGTNRRIIFESSAITYYRQSDGAALYLICDDAPQFNKIAKHLALCWIHEARHYKKLNPLSNLNQKTITDFIEKFWDYYKALLTYKQSPTDKISLELSDQFDSLFSTKTGYDALDQRIAMTLAKKDSLLLVLAHPFLPLHNNPAELGTRVQARIRDINLQTISENGTKTKDTFATIVQTARKLGVNIYQYIYDKVSRKFEIPSLAEMIMAQINTPSTA